MLYIQCCINHPCILAPPRSPTQLTGPKLVSWVTSSKRRYSSELAKDASIAKDRAIMTEVSDGFKAGLAADQARERREAEEARAALEAERVATANAAAVKAQAMAEKARRAAILVREFDINIDLY